MSDWRDFPFIFGRVATQQDFEAGLAVYYQEPPSTAYTEINLPILAELKTETGELKTVVILQTENHSDNCDVVVGYRTLAGDKGVALLSEFKALPL
ncbi:hypothetical protein Q1W73_04630 [Asticcacaulis sp. ZE23SCel15]|uniref:hypothetical protein n=1 Tax=Asticcacaulis sp. ZE23SCel15 TaxID=3059027 RepID=UPI00265D6E2B|nr:hypothetical protein [Asticcacaulis sp. ZE23SCel15]WKL58272.1 hypothetical protein Q1W73_04630 [Asticcacaulis sp. ZE23SCel15]